MILVLCKSPRTHPVAWHHACEKGKIIILRTLKTSKNMLLYVSFTKLLLLNSAYP